MYTSLVEDNEALNRRVGELEARVAELVAALESIAVNACCDRCQEAALVARAALAKEGE